MCSLNKSDSNAAILWCLLNTFSEKNSHTLLKRKKKFHGMYYPVFKMFFFIGIMNSPIWLSTVKRRNKMDDKKL